MFYWFTSFKMFYHVLFCMNLILFAIIAFLSHFKKCKLSRIKIHFSDVLFFCVSFVCFPSLLKHLNIFVLIDLISHAGWEAEEEVKMATWPKSVTPHALYFFSSSKFSDTLHSARHWEGSAISQCHHRVWAATAWPVQVRQSTCGLNRFAPRACVACLLDWHSWHHWKILPRVLLAIINIKCINIALRG